MGINYDYACTICGGASIINVKYDDRDETQPCDECGGASIRVYKTFHGRTEKLSASFVDGQKRPGFEELKTEARLKQAAAEAGETGGDYEEINKEFVERRAKRKE